MDVKITPSALTGEIDAISSKSHFHRLLIAAALANKKSVIFYNKMSDDIKATLRCLSKLGARFDITEHQVSVTPIKERPVQKALLDFGECGTTYRLLLPLAVIFSESAELSGHGRLSKRPIKELCRTLSENGAVFSESTLPMTVSGNLRSGIYTIPGSVSSQYISGLLFALPLLKGQSELVVEDGFSSRGYIDLTLDVLKEFGITVIEKGNRFIIPGDQKYITKGNLYCEGDWSNSAFWLAAGAIGGRVSVKDLNDKSYQPDRDVFNLLCLFGASVKSKKAKFTVSPIELKAYSFDADSIPDLVPIMSVIAALSDGNTVIFNAGRLREKESDRLSAIRAFLSSLGADITETEDGLNIDGKDSLAGGEVDGCNDHRIVMAAAIASCGCRGEVVIHGAEAINKSYPDFFEDFTALGGRVKVLS